MHTYIICENTIIIKKCIYFVILLKNNLQTFPNVAIHMKIVPFYENYHFFSPLVLKILNSPFYIEQKNLKILIHSCELYLVIIINTSRGNSTFKTVWNRIILPP